MKIGIIGQKWLAAELFKRLAEDHDIAFAAAPTSHDRLAIAAVQRGLRPVAYSRRPIDWAGVPDLDLLIAAHAFVRIPTEVLVKARFAVGYHPSLLPLYRGMDAVGQAVSNGDPVTGGTVYHLTDNYDEGPIAAQGWCFVLPGETPAELWRRALAPMGLHLLAGVVADLSRSGQVPSKAQSLSIVEEL